MTSEVRKVLEVMRKGGWDGRGIYVQLDAAERADAARREAEVSFVVECKRCGQSTCTSPENSAVCGCGAVFKLHRHDQQADGAPRDESAQELRRKVAELVARWSGRYVHLDAVMMVRNILAELNAIIATEPDPVENRQATASGTVKSRNFGDVIRKKLQENPELAEQVADEHIRSIAAMAVRDAMPDVLDGLAETFGEEGFPSVTNAFREQADKLRKERGA